ncbi:glycoside hydrolase family 2 TIM barrel-domain containing protein [Lachnospiraceae bacterium 45-W7]
MKKKLIAFFLSCAVAITGIPCAGLDGIVTLPVLAAENEANTGEWNGHPEIFQVNREPARATFYNYDSVEKAKAKDKAKSEYYQLLNGEDWKFNWAVKPADRIGVKDADFNTADYDDSAWDDIKVPKDWNTYVKEDGSWKYDPVIYSNQNYPWFNAEGKNYSNYKVGDAPVDCNPVGTYRKTFTVDPSWSGRQVFIDFEGVASAMYLWVNGEYIGYSEDSFTRNEFNITDALDFSSGNENVITVEVYRWSDGSYIENQDMVRPCGIFRDVYLMSKDTVEIRDFTVVTDLDENYENADLNVEVDVRQLKATKGGDSKLTLSETSVLLEEGESKALTAEVETTESESDTSAYTVEANLYAADGTLVTSTPLTGAVQSFEDGQATVALTQNISNPLKWSAEKPNLYNLILELKRDGTTIETTQVDVGFREVEITDANTDDARLRVNGQIVTIAGVNRHENDPQDGHYLTEEEMRQEIELMKSLNINALRASHYPEDPFMYELCDEYGIYIMDEANVESHNGRSQYQVPGSLPGYIEAAEDRAINMLERDKNYPSVILWSPGNETGSGDSLQAEIDYFQANDETRPVHYQGWNDNAGVDVWSAMYPNIGKQIKNQKKPFLMCEYLHAMGNSAGGMKEYWEEIRTNGILQGGYIWDWVDQTYNTPQLDENGTWDGKTTYWGYDGDWNYGTYTDGDGNEKSYESWKSGNTDFCVNGIISPDRTLQPEAYEVKRIYQALQMSLKDLATRTVTINNEWIDTNANEYTMKWALVKDAKEVETGTMEVDIPAMTSKDIEVPFTAPASVKAGEEYFLQITFVTKTDDQFSWAKAGHVVAEDQFELNFEAEGELPLLDTSSMDAFVTEGTSGTVLSETDDTLSVKGADWSVAFDKKTGEMTSYKTNGKELIADPLEPNYWRAKTDNDAKEAIDSKWANANKTAEIDEVSVEKKDKVVYFSVARTLTGCADSKDRLTYAIYPTGEIVVKSTLVPTSKMSNLPRVGNRMQLAAGFDNLTWYGRGESDSYVDRKTGYDVGLWKSTVDEQFTDFVYPQETGNKTDVRWMALTDSEGDGLLIDAVDHLLEMSALNCTQEALEAAKHPYQIARTDNTVVTIDYAQMGLGTASCGQPTLAKYLLTAGPVYTYTFRLKPVNGAAEEALMEDAKIAYADETDLLAEIKIGEKVLPKFHNDVTNYSFNVASPDGSVPTVTATPKSEDVTVKITQAEALPGTATIVATSKNGYSRTFTIELKQSGEIQLSEIGYDQEKSVAGFGGIHVNEDNGGGTLNVYIDGEPVTFENGFGVNSPTELYFDVSGLNIERLQGYAGIDVDKQKTQDGCYAVVKVDGTEVFKSDLLTDGKDAAYFDIDVTGAKEICLYVDQNIKDGHDMVSWCDTKVILQGFYEKPLQLELKETATVRLDAKKKILYNVPAGTTEAQLREMFALPEGGTFEMEDPYNAEEPDSAPAATGYLAKLYMDGSVKDTLQIAVNGDVDGSADGKIDVADLNKLRETLAGNETLDALNTYAADVNQDGAIDVKDLAAMLKASGSDISGAKEDMAWNLSAADTTDTEDGTVTITGAISQTSSEAKSAMSAGEFVLNYDPATYAAGDITLADGVKGGISVKKSDGSVKVVYNLTEAVTVSGDLFKAVFTLADGALQKETQFTVSDLSVVAGDQTLFTTTSQGASVTPKGAAGAVNVTGISITGVPETITLGQTFALTAEVAPADATEKGVTWASSNTKVATVDENGSVCVIGIGTTQLTATTKEEGSSVNATVEITVSSEYASMKYSYLTAEVNNANKIFGTDTPESAEYGRILLDTASTSGWGGFHVNEIDNGEKTSGTGISMKINGVQTAFDQGLSANTDCTMKFDLTGLNAKRLQAWAGIDWTKSTKTGRDGADFRFYKDSIAEANLLYQTGTIGQQDNAKFVDVDLTGVTTLVIYVDKVGTNSDDCIDLADAKVYCEETSRATLSKNAVDMVKAPASVQGQSSEEIPDGARTAEITWSSEDPTVATVKDGVVTGVKAGKTVIIAQCQNMRARCTVEVKKKAQSNVTVTFDADNGADLVTVSVAQGTKVERPADPEKEGFVFAGWFAKGAEEEFDFDTPVTADLTLTAKWISSSDACTVTFKNGTDTERKVVVKGQSVEKPADPEKFGHTFEGWFAGDAPEAFDFETAITEDITLTAKWQKISANVDDYEALGAAIAAAEELDASKYTEESWANLQKALSDAKEKAESPTATQAEIDAAKEAVEAAVKALEEEGGLPAVSHTVTFRADNGSEDETQTIADGKKAKEPADPKKFGHTFEGWFAGDAPEAFDFETAITADITLTAKWQKISANVDDYEALGAAIAAAEELDASKYTAESWANLQKALSYAKEKAESPTATQAEIDAAKEAVEAAVKALTGPEEAVYYTVTFNADNGSALTTQTVQKGSLVQKPGDPVKAGYTFTGWYAQGAATAFDFTTAITSDLTLTAKWVENAPLPGPGPEPVSIASATVKVAKTTYNGKQRKPAVTVTYNGTKLKLNTDYKVSYSNNKKVGQGKIKITGIGSYTGTKNVVFDILPKASKITKITNKAGRKLVLKLKKSTGAKGYEITYATNKKFKSAKKQKTNKTTVTLKNLKKNKTYYVKVRAYAKSGKKTIYSGSYSKTVKIKVKK